MNKRSARALAKARVKTLSDAEKLIKSGVIVNDVLSFVDENGIKSVFVYKSSDDEVQTNAIIDGLFERGVKVYIPKISGDLMRLSVISKNRNSSEIFSAYSKRRTTAKTFSMPNLISCRLWRLTKLSQGSDTEKDITTDILKRRRGVSLRLRTTVRKSTRSIPKLTT